MSVFYYDADCGFCTWAVGHLRRMTTNLTTAPGRGLYIQRNAYYVDDNGKEFLGHRGISHALLRHGRTALIRFLGRVVGIPPAAIIYRLVAMNRHRLGPLVGVSSCQI
ncbi:thiol-disulfide oxidoreductase DCC family protein [Corynebacterium epidermidicanis]|uniref:DUF393 family protein n=1 Tax=Corynebacterium epidermidicanis TaxID=1050174 RepID=A0A0G3GU88_9CORY|nr:hypothetical protein [Corynebacterium epidermidicanis]AKK02432.1 hypothetical protein CEPID_02760 [Corynebacterium epidermidicanis]